MKWLIHFALLAALAAPMYAYALFDQCKALFPNQQIPTSAEIGRDLCFDDFAIYYSPRDKKPIYTVERINGEALKGPRPRRSNQFYEEARLPLQERSLLSDYRESGFDRGHNVPAGNMTTEKGMAQSFSLANMMPQARLNNQGVWAKRVEEPTRLYAKRIENDIYVFTGSVGSLGSIGNSRVTIPSPLYKLVYDPSKKLAWAYWVENANDAQVKPLISYAELKQKTGIDFHLPITDETTTPKLIAASPQNTKTIVGAWYPVFFDQFSSGKVTQIISDIQAGKVSSIDIQYDRNIELANKIAQQIRTQTTLAAHLIQSSPPDSPGVSYERNRVTLIIHSK